MWSITALLNDGNYQVTFPGNSHFLVIHISCKVTITGKSHFPGGHISHKVKFSMKLHFPGSHIFREVTFSEKSNFQGNQFFREVIFPGKSHIPGICISWEFSFPLKSSLSWSHISREVTFPRKSYFPRSYILREVSFPGNSHLLGIHISPESHISWEVASLVWLGLPEFENGIWRRRRRIRKTTCWPAALVADGLAAGKKSTLAFGIIFFRITETISRIRSPTPLMHDVAARNRLLKEMAFPRPFRQLWYFGLFCH